jgi:glycosyltransferase involved in cell wall biosynthesis
MWCKTAFTAVITSRRDMGFWYSKAILYGLRLANTCVSGIVCNSEAVARLVAEREHVGQEKLVVINNALPRKDSLPVSIAPFSEAVRPPADVNICLVANIRPIKRIGDLVLAAAQVLQTCPQARFWIAGAIPDTPYARDLVDLPHRLGIQHRLTFLGKIEEPLQLVEQCQIGVLTSESEGLSNSIIEYMACGLPVVCTDVGGNRELVRHNENGYLFPAGDIHCLAAHLINLTHNPFKRADMGKCSLQRLHIFSVDSAIARYLAFYTSVKSLKQLKHKVLDQ